MENDEIYEKLKLVIEETKRKAERSMLVQADKKDHKNNIFQKTGKYKPWMLEPIHVAERLGLSESELVKLIYDTQDMKIINLWTDFIRFKNLVIFHDPEYSMVKKEVAEFAIGLYKKNDTMKVDVIIKPLEKDHRKLLTTISQLEKEVKYLKGGKDGKYTT